MCVFIVWRMEMISRVGERCWVTTDVVVRVEMPEPVYSWPLIEWSLRGALEQIVARLHVKQSRPSQIHIHLLGGKVEALSVRIRFGRPSRNVEQLIRICRHRMETMKLTAPVDVCWIEVEEETQDHRGQYDLLDRRQVDEALPEVVARIANALGEGSVFQAVAFPSWRPEYAWRSVTVGAGEASSEMTLKKPDPVAIQRGDISFLPRPRPHLLLPRPLPIFIETKENRPSKIKFEGQWWNIDMLQGPENFYRMVGERWGHLPKLLDDFVRRKSGVGYSKMMPQSGRFMDGTVDETICVSRMCGREIS